MTPQFFPGASYRCELVTGEYVQLFAGSHLDTHLGRVPFPAAESFGVIELDCTNIGGFKFAGLAHDTPAPGRICEWSDATGWRFHDGPLASPVRYDARGTLHYQPIPAPEGGWSSQGYRYADDLRVYTGDETFALPAIGVWEYVRIADLVIGQGHEGGIVVVGPDNVPRSLVAGFYIRIQARTDGVRAVVSAWQSVHDRSVTFRGTLDELRTLPPVVSTPAPSPAPPVPVPAPRPPTPQPPTPNPQPPTPNPAPTPEEPQMIAYGSPVPGFAAGDLVDNGDGTVSVQKPNGKFLCVTPEGGIEERDTPGGLWESFRKGKASLIAERDGGTRGAVVYILPLVE